MSTLETYPEYVNYNGTSTEEVVSQRMAICNPCESLRGQTCVECACNIPIKVRSPLATCPIGKW
jgi:hypothetical protein